MKLSFLLLTKLLAMFQILLRLIKYESKIIDPEYRILSPSINVCLRLTLIMGVLKQAKDTVLSHSMLIKKI